MARQTARRASPHHGPHLTTWRPWRAGAARPTPPHTSSGCCRRQRVRHRPHWAVAPGACPLPRHCPLQSRHSRARRLPCRPTSRDASSSLGSAMSWRRRRSACGRPGRRRCRIACASRFGSLHPMNSVGTVHPREITIGAAIVHRGLQRLSRGRHPISLRISLCAAGRELYQRRVCYFRSVCVACMCGGDVHTPRHTVCCAGEPMVLGHTAVQPYDSLVQHATSVHTVEHTAVGGAVPCTTMSDHQSQSRNCGTTQLLRPLIPTRQTCYPVIFNELTTHEGGARERCSFLHYKS